MALPDEIWLVDVGEPFPGEAAYRRPALIVGPSRLFGDRLPFVIVIPMTTVHRRMSLHVEVESGAATGLSEVSYAQCELVRSISTRRLSHLLGRVSMQTAREIETVIKRLLDY
jgi:mRNA interferase MazF